MKFPPDLNPPLQQSGAFLCPVLIAGVLVLTGCSKQSATVEPSAAPSVVETNPASMPAAENQPVFVPPAAPATVAAGADGGADLKALNHAYIGWIVQNHQRPKTFEAFIAASGMQVPPAPAGKKYVIDKSGFINLVSQ